MFSATETVLQVFRWKLIDAEDSMNNQMASVTVTYRSCRVVQLENRLVSASSGLLEFNFYFIFRGSKILPEEKRRMQRGRVRLGRIWGQGEEWHLEGTIWSRRKGPWQGWRFRG